MNYDNWKVTEDDERPARPDGTCFYCKEPIGNEHKPDCVVRSRTVVIRFMVDVVVSVPENWDKTDIEFMYNEGSWCASNLVEMLKEKPGCLCSCTEAEYVREATEADEENWKGEIIHT